MCVFVTRIMHVSVQKMAGCLSATETNKEKGAYLSVFLRQEPTEEDAVRTLQK